MQGTVLVALCWLFLLLEHPATPQGPPLPPSLQYSGIDEYTLRVFWEEPYTAEGFPITSYFLTVVDSNQTSQTMLADTRLSPDARAYNVTREDASSCTNLTIEVRAENAFGNGSADTYGAFPSGPGDFQMPPNIAVTFSKDISPILHINFIFPSLCLYNNATYVIEIEDETGRAVHTVGPTNQHWRDGGSLISMDLRDIGLESNVQYILNITVWTTVNHISSVSNFNATAPVTSVPSDNLDLAEVVAPIIGGVAVVILKIIVCIICIRRRIRRIKREYTIDHINGRNRKLDMPMVDNPIYDREEINPNFMSTDMSITTPAASNLLLEKCSLEKANDDYTKMTSAGTLLGQLSVNGGAGAAAIKIPAGEEIVCFSNEEGASAQCSGQQQQDLEGHYITFNS